MMLIHLGLALLVDVPRDENITGFGQIGSQLLGQRKDRKGVAEMLLDFILYGGGKKGSEDHWAKCEGPSERDTNGLTAENSELKLRLQTMEQQVHLQDATTPSNDLNGNKKELQFILTTGYGVLQRNLSTG
ncbi:hypothetical protein TEA_009622 [Camellia sinensis var. sinensis]|uniref:Uncharacterized protein n=1 Tax=Camellia sinensis var. sinensis TaxID=542762 RepID=A0A4S4DWE2_CAMSN|nr:hypothetical protein TEA_009622 [Camellia sinensis var. sinensis]